MSLTSYLFSVLAAVIILLVVVEALRRRRLRERHAIWWLVAGILALIAALFPATLEWTSRLVGVEIPTNLVFFVAIAVQFLVSLQHSTELTDLENKVRTLSERIAIQDERIVRLERRPSE